MGLGESQMHPKVETSVSRGCVRKGKEKGARTGAETPTSTSSWGAVIYLLQSGCAWKGGVISAVREGAPGSYPYLCHNHGGWERHTTSFLP